MRSREGRIWTNEKMSLPESLERAASELADLADQIRPANGDPHRLLEELDAAQAGRVLTWILAQEPDDAAELVEAWGDDDAGVPVLLSIPDDGLTKAGRKLLRKERHRLRSQGIAVETPSAPGAAVTGSTTAPAKSAAARRAAAVDRWQAAHVSSPDFRGARMGYLVDSHPSGGARLFEIRFDEGRGILDFKIYNAGRAKVRGFLKSLTAGTGRRLFDVDRDALRALVWRASRAQPVDRPLPTSFVEWRSRLFSEDLEKVPTPGDLAREELGEGDPAASLTALLAEVQQGSLGPWPPPTSWVGDWMERGREALDGLEGEAREKKIEGWIDEVAASLAEQTDFTLIARHLDELAWVRWQAEQEQVARSLLSVSTALGEDPETRGALTRARVESLFEPYLAELRKPAQDDDSSSADPEAGQA